MIEVTVLIPTLRRPESLTRALRSVFLQEGVDHRATEIVVVDNSPEASARSVVEALAPLSHFNVVYAHEPKPGVATARNAGLAASSGRYIAFLDDDEEASPAWLAALMRTHRALEATVTFGPVQGRADVCRPDARAYMERFFSRVGPTSSGAIAMTFGCGNSVMTRETALPGSTPFDAAADQTGGEDDRLFTRLKGESARFGWAADAVVVEHAPPHRTRLSYTLRRAIGYGQSPSQICARTGDPLGVAKWMLVGAAQCLLYGLAAFILWLGRRPERYALADRAARGLGKVIWPNFLHFYGAAEARRSSMSARGWASRTDSAVNMTQT